MAPHYSACGGQRVGRLELCLVQMRIGSTAIIFTLIQPAIGLDPTVAEAWENLEFLNALTVPLAARLYPDQ